MMLARSNRPEAGGSCDACVHGTSLGDERVPFHGQGIPVLRRVASSPGVRPREPRAETAPPSGELGVSANQGMVGQGCDMHRHGAVQPGWHASATVVAAIRAWTMSRNAKRHRSFVKATRR